MSPRSRAIPPCDPPDTVTRKSILIVSADTLGAALLGGAVELAGLEPLFQYPDEPPRAALRRTRPSVVLVDCGSPDACDESFIGPALMTGSRVILLRSTRTTMPDTIARLALPTIELPGDAVRLADVLGA